MLNSGMLTDLGQLGLWNHVMIAAMNVGMLDAAVHSSMIVHSLVKKTVLGKPNIMNVRETVHNFAVGIAACCNHH